MPQQIIIDNDGNLKVFDVGPIGPPGFTEPGVPGDEGPMGPVGPSAVTVGTLAERPDASEFDSDQLFLADNDQGGRLWAKKGAGWIPAGPSVNSANAGQVVARKALAADEEVTTIVGTPVRFTGLTTPVFPLPANAIVEHSVFVSSGHLSGGVPTTFQIMYSTDSWATKHLIMAGIKAPNDGGAPFYWAQAQTNGPIMLPADGQTLAVGTNVQVGVFAVREDVKAIKILKNVTFGMNPFIQVRAG